MPTYIKVLISTKVNSWNWILNSLFHESFNFMALIIKETYTMRDHIVTGINTLTINPSLRNIQTNQFDLTLSWRNCRWILTANEYFLLQIITKTMKIVVYSNKKKNGSLQVYNSNSPKMYNPKFLVEFWVTACNLYVYYNRATCTEKRLYKIFVIYIHSILK